MQPRRRPASAAETASESRDENDVMRITPLGAGQEVGRSCIVLEFKQKTIMLDCGLHPAHSGLAALPFFDNVDPAAIDILLVTHFHIDHAAALPYFMEKTTFRGRVFMTHPTKAIFKWLLADYVKVSNLAVDDMLYDEKDLLRAYDKIEAIDFHQQVDVEGIKFTAYNAGHVLGAAMFLIEVAGVRVLYTGDYSREEDRHLMAAEKPPNVTPEVLISESTYGVQTHQSRIERETQFTKTVTKVVQRGGRCLIPVFALGRAQELLLILDEYWQAHPELHNVPIYYASALAKKCMTVYQTYSNMMNQRIRMQSSSGANPFHFKHISNLKRMQEFDDVGACVMMVSPGMLQNGQSRELLERWCTDHRNGVLIPGYVVDGTLGHDIVNNKIDMIPQMNGGPKLPLNLLVEYVSFSAHVDYAQNSQFIEDVGASNLVLVHGASIEMGRLRSALASKYHESERKLHIFTPKNCEAVELYFKGERMAKAIGTLAKDPLKPNTRIAGVLVAKDFTYRLMAPANLPLYTDLTAASLAQRLVVSCRAPFSLVRWHLEALYGPVRPLPHKDEIDDEEGEGEDGFVVFGTVTVRAVEGGRRVVLEWEGNAVNDMIADSVVAIIVQAESSPASVKATRSVHKHSHDHDEDVKDEEALEGDAPPTKKVAVDASGDDEDTMLPARGLSEDSAGGSDTEFEDVVTEYFAHQFGTDGVERDRGQLDEEGMQPKEEEEEVAPGTSSRVDAPPAAVKRRSWKIKLDGNVAGVVLERGKVPKIESTSDELHRRVAAIASRIKKTLDPIGDSWTPSV